MMSLARRWSFIALALIGSTACGNSDEPTYFNNAGEGGMIGSGGGPTGGAATAGADSGGSGAVGGFGGTSGVGFGGVAGMSGGGIAGEHGGSAGTGAVGGGAPSCVESDPCRSTAGAGFCRGGNCVVCAPVSDDAACTLAYGTGEEPYICVSGRCVPGCRADSQCDTGNCVDGVCCNTPLSQCSGCKACNLAGYEGICTNVRAGQDPHDFCNLSAAGCRADTCDGSGTCALADDSPCGSSSCSTGVETIQSCQDGICTSSTRDCGGLGCSGNLCAQSCTVGTDMGCPAGTYCLSGTACPPKLGLGTTCSANNQCLSGNCVDSVCCDTPASSCSGCLACNLTGSLGACSFVPSGADPHDTCTANTANCRQANCDGEGGCLAPDDTPCRNSSCTAGVQTLYECSEGTCVAITTSCGNFTCSSSVCATACTPATDAGCASGTFCDAGGTACLPKLANGTSCSGGSQCQSGNCVDGVCCDKSAAQCSGCMACNVTGSVGVCSNVPVGSDPHDVCTANVSGCIQANCDGKGGCKAADGTTCEASTCSNGTRTDRMCQNGSCSDSTISCGNFACSGSGCATSCTVGTNVGCKAGTVCSGGTTCVSGLANGSACIAGTDCNSGNCVDGVCCNVSACSGCKACNVSGLAGTCSNVPLGQDPHDFCTQNISSCDSGTCDGSGACGPLAEGSVCQYGGCAENDCISGQCTSTIVSGRTCTSQGACGQQQQQNVGSCPGNLVCASMTSCLSMCGSDADCIKGYFCNAGNCTAKLTNGEMCTTDSQCASSRCNSYGRCSACDTGVDCTLAEPVCMEADSFANPGSCSGPCMSGAECTAGRWGDNCSSGECSCSSDSQCNIRAPRCNITSDVCSCGSSGPCALGTVCTNRLTSGTCRVEPGFPCQAGLDCASGTCTNGVCARLASGQPCDADRDCASNSCDNYSCG